mmetsp:Transcript_42082/g.98746  ORF Transcript_42082/g.98746 Transcript_42082/m.98746 type:complete len:282 (+) Transcript_42082:856-1701(+)
MQPSRHQQLPSRHQLPRSRQFLRPSHLPPSHQHLLRCHPHLLPSPLLPSHRHLLPLPSRHQLLRSRQTQLVEGTQCDKRSLWTRFTLGCHTPRCNHPRNLIVHPHPRRIWLKKILPAVHGLFLSPPSRPSPRRPPLSRPLVCLLPRHPATTLRFGTSRRRCLSRRRENNGGGRRVAWRRQWKMLLGTSRGRRRPLQRGSRQHEHIERLAGSGRKRASLPRDGHHASRGPSTPMMSTLSKGKCTTHILTGPNGVPKAPLKPQKTRRERRGTRKKIRDTQWRR